MKKVEAHVADAVAKGARILTGGRHALGGTFFQPTVIAGVTRDMIVSGEETFGPVAPLFRFADEAEVIAQANDTIFGLAAYFYARDLGRVWRWPKRWTTASSGEHRHHLDRGRTVRRGEAIGLGREGSRHGIEEYLEMKYVCLSV